MSTSPLCPVCGMPNTYPDGEQFVCADCGHEWSAAEVAGNEDEQRVVKDSNGNVLVDGDSVILIKDLKVKGIRIVDGDHDIDCKVDGVAMSLKSEFLKKA